MRKKSGAKLKAIKGIKKGSKSHSLNRPKKKNKEVQSQSIEAGWVRREVMSRPSRSKYVRRELKDEGCAFCFAESIPPELSTLCLYQDEYAMILVNKYPYNSGHLMVLPRRHVGDLTLLTEEEFQFTQKLIVKTIEVLKKVYRSEGFNIGMNMGRVAGAGIPDHLHWHIIPRWSGDTNFFPIIGGTKVILETADETYLKLEKYFSGGAGE